MSTTNVLASASAPRGFEAAPRRYGRVAYPPGILIDAASGGVLVAFGLLALAVRPRSAPTLAFAVFGVAYGTRAVVDNLVDTRGWSWETFLTVACFLVAASALVVFGATFPTRLRLRERGAVAVGAVLVGIAAVMGTSYRGASFLAFSDGFSDDVAMLAFVFASGLMAVRFAAAPPGERGRLALVGASLAILPMVRTATLLGSGAYVWDRAVAAFGLAQMTAYTTTAFLVPAMVAATWGYAAYAARDRRAWAVALGAPALGVVVLALVPWFGGADAGDSGLHGAARTAAVVVLAFAFARGGFLGGRLALRHGTVATALLGVVFVVAQVAQNFLSAQYGLVMGGVIAGMLLFVANPIQRAAERIVSGETPGRRGEHRYAEAYRLAVRAAVGDGRLTRDEEGHLAELAEHLGIGAGEALRLRREVEEEVPQDSA